MSLVKEKCTSPAFSEISEHSIIQVIQDHEVDEQFRKKMRNDLFWLRGLNEEDKDAWAELVPINVDTDGNCICHAACLSVYGHIDSHLKLRNALYEHMLKYQSKFFDVYRQYQTKLNTSLGEAAFTMSWDEWKKEYANVLECAKPKKGKFQKSLEPIHIYGLADLLSRTIIVYATPNPDSSSSNFAGIYLPNFQGAYWNSETELVNPILMAYDNGHVRALLVNSRCLDTEADKLTIEDANGKCMPIHFPIYEDGGDDSNFDINESNDDNMTVNQFSGNVTLPM